MAIPPCYGTTWISENRDMEKRMKPLVLVINPGSTSTKLALFRDGDCIAKENRRCPTKELDRCESVIDQVGMRTQSVRDFLKNQDVAIKDLSAIAARGGPLKPMAGGVYAINDAMLSDAKGACGIEHVSRIACIVADDLGRSKGVPGYTVDHVSTDEFEPISRISGLKECPRLSLTHALNMKAVARAYANELGKSYESLNLLTVQLGGGSSMAIHSNGRMIDSVDGNGEGPFSPERSGGIRVDSLAKWIDGKGLSFMEALKRLTRSGGLMSHLGTTDAMEVERRIDDGDDQAKLVYQAMAYAISKHLCGLAAAVNGQVDGIVMTGGLARSEMLTGWITERVGFLAPVRIMPGEMEMDALNQGVLRVLNGEETAKAYK
jgi:butyrate kinase